MFNRSHLGYCTGSVPETLRLKPGESVFADAGFVLASATVVAAVGIWRIRPSNSAGR